MKEKDIDRIERFILDFEHTVKQLDNYSEYLKLGEATEQLRDEAMSILKKKIKKMKKAEDKDDLKKVLRVNKVLQKDFPR